MSAPTVEDCHRLALVVRSFAQAHEFAAGRWLAKMVADAAVSEEFDRDVFILRGEWAAAIAALYEEPGPGRGVVVRRGRRGDAARAGPPTSGRG